MFKAILSVLTARWFVTLIGAIILALVVWFVGPLIAVGNVRPLDSEIIRLIAEISMGAGSSVAKRRMAGYANSATTRDAAW